MARSASWMEGTRTPARARRSDREAPARMSGRFVSRANCSPSDRPSFSRPGRRSSSRRRGAASSIVSRLVSGWSRQRSSMSSSPSAKNDRLVVTSGPYAPAVVSGFPHQYTDDAALVQTISRLNETPDAQLKRARDSVGHGHFDRSAARAGPMPGDEPGMARDVVEEAEDDGPAVCSEGLRLAAAEDRDAGRAEGLAGGPFDLGVQPAIIAAAEHAHGRLHVRLGRRRTLEALAQAALRDGVRVDRNRRDERRREQDDEEGGGDEEPVGERPFQNHDPATAPHEFEASRTSTVPASRAVQQRTTKKVLPPTVPES